MNGPWRVNDIWFELDLGRIETDGYGGQHRYPVVSKFARVTFTAEPKLDDDMRHELHRLLDGLLDQIVREYGREGR